MSVDPAKVPCAVSAGDGALTRLSLVEAGPFSATPLALVDGNGRALCHSDLLGLQPLSVPLFGNLLTDYVIPFTGGLIVRSVLIGSSWSGTTT
jgi:hypothetical protein